MRFRFEKKFIFMFLFVFLILLSSSISLYIQELNSSVGYEKLIIGLKEGVPVESGFNINEVKDLNRIISAKMDTYYAYDNIAVFSEKGVGQVQVFGVLGNYNEFNRVQLIEGSFINEHDNRLRRNVAVIENNLVEELFGGEDILGLDVEIYNKKFTVIGIVSTEKSSIERVLDGKIPRVFIPLDTMIDLNPYIYIGNIEYLSSDSEFDNAFVMDKITLIGKDADDFFIEDMNITGVQQSQKYNILFFILGAYCIYRLIRLTIDIVKHIIAYSKNKLRYHYFLDMLKKGKSVYIKAIVAILGILILGGFIWSRISFSLYISPEKIPDNPASITQIFSSISSYITEFINFNYAYPVYEIEVTRFFQKINGIVFLLGLVFEILCISFLKNKKPNRIKTNVDFLLNIGIYFIASILLSVVIIHLMGLPIVVSIVDILLTWVCFIIITYSREKRYLEIFFSEMRRGDLFKEIKG